MGRWSLWHERAECFAGRTSTVRSRSIKPIRNVVQTKDISATHHPARRDRHLKAYPAILVNNRGIIDKPSSEQLPLFRERSRTPAPPPHGHISVDSDPRLAPLVPRPLPSRTCLVIAILNGRLQDRSRRLGAEIDIDTFFVFRRFYYAA